MMIKMFVLACGALMMSNVVFAQEAADALIEKFQSHRHYHAHFHQTFADQQDNVVQESEGEVWMAFPAKFRWHYEKPFPQQLISDGRLVWIYDPELEQAQVQTIDDLAQNALVRVLAGELEYIKKTFDVSEQTNGDDIQWFRLESLDPSLEFSVIMLGFSTQGLSRVELSVKTGETHQLRFSDIHLEQIPADQWFQFQPPEGTDVAGDLSLLTN